MNNLNELIKLIRYYILISTTEAGSGHPSSSLSGVELTATLMFGGFFKFDVKNPDNQNNDRLIFSKGHAAPLFYSLWAVAGQVKKEELLSLRKFGSVLEGHPTMRFSFTEAATGSLGQGLSVGVGMAINAKYLDKTSYRIFVLMGDSEMAEGSVWEAMQLSAYYKLDNLVGIIDVNRLGQRGETMYGYDLEVYRKKVEAFGWEAIVVNGHSVEEITAAYSQAEKIKGRPVMIIAKTVKGKGVSFIENKDGWHGKPLNKEELSQALVGLGSVQENCRGEISSPLAIESKDPGVEAAAALNYPADKTVSTRRAYGNALARLGSQYPRVVALDAETSNSTFAEIFKIKFPERFFEMFIAEQNMVGTALGLSCRGKIPFVSTFAAFFTRAFDQIRMSRYSEANIKFVGSHAGVSIGEDGLSQMGLEDVAMFRTLPDSVVLYPSDAVATERLIEEAINYQGVVYLRTTRKDTPIIYSSEEKFIIGGSKVLRRSVADQITVIGAGVTLYEALAAYDLLKKEGINMRVIDLYSVKPIDVETIKEAALETEAIVTVEDHYHEGGLGEAVLYCLAELARVQVPVYILAVRKLPQSGKPQELLDYEEISTQAIVRKVKEILIRN